MVQFEPLSPDDFETYLDSMLPGYAEEQARCSGISIEDARRGAEEHVARFRPGAPGAEASHAFGCIDAASGEAVGVVWLLVQGKDTFIADIRIDEDRRGQGLGTAAMQRVEEFAREQGCNQVRLHVFAANRPAVGLYEKLGYETASLQMRKPLD